MRSPELTAHLTRDPEVLRKRFRKATETRVRRAKLKEALAGGRVDASTVATKLPWWLQTMKVYQFLLHVPYVGPEKTDAFLRSVRISDARSFRGLTPRQHADLVAALENIEAAAAIAELTS